MEVVLRGELVGMRGVWEREQRRRSSGKKCVFVREEGKEEEQKVKNCV